MSIKITKSKVLIIVIISLICAAVAVSFIYINLLFPAPISKHSMEYEFSKQKDILLKVTEYLEKQDYSSVYITSTDAKGEMFVSKNKQEVGKVLRITDESIATSITELFEKYKYNVITKEGNGIYYQRWSNRDYGRGAVYSMNGERPTNELLTKLEPMSMENWYFYEEN